MPGVTHKNVHGAQVHTFTNGQQHVSLWRNIIHHNTIQYNTVL